MNSVGLDGSREQLCVRFTATRLHGAKNFVQVCSAADFRQDAKPVFQRFVLLSRTTQERSEYQRFLKKNVKAKSKLHGLNFVVDRILAKFT